MSNLKQGSTVTFTKGKQYTVKLKGKVGKSSISLFLERYLGTKEIDGRKVPKVDKEFLKINISHNPKSKEEKEHYFNSLKIAESIRLKREQDAVYKDAGLLNTNNQKMNFLSYIDSYLGRYTKKDYHNIKAVIKAFKQFIGKEVIYPRDVNHILMNRFKDYLLDSFNGETPHSYFARFKKILNYAVEDGMFLKNPASKVTCKSPSGIRKAILSVDEIRQLYETPCNREGVKKGFLFCLNTGLRYVDVVSLKYSDISNGRIVLTQAKTGNQVIIDLNIDALELIGGIKDSNDFVFDIPTKSYAMKVLKRWCKEAGINKNLTWHSARHTFATLLLQNNVNIKTVSSLLGHTSTTQTQKYLHIVDSLKKDAVDSLSILNIGRG